MVGPVKDQLRWQVWAYRLSEGGTHLPGITLHTLYPSITPVLSGIIMSLYYRPYGNQSPTDRTGSRTRRGSLAARGSLAFGTGLVGYDSLGGTSGKYRVIRTLATEDSGRDDGARK